MPPEPPNKRTFVFIDGQNLFYAVKQAFGYSYPNYDPLLLAQWVCQQRGWQLAETHFYTGLPQVKDSAFWNHFWMGKLAVMGTRGIKTFSRHLKYRNQTVHLPGGKTTTVLVGQEKGVDVRLALDVVRFTRENKYDVAVIFSQDQDLSELAGEVRSIAHDYNRWIKLACAYPVSPTTTNSRGISGMDWIRFRLHNLRHSLSNWLVNQAKVDPKTVQEMLRHSKVQTTLDLYTQGDNDNKISAQDKFCGLIVDQPSSGETSASA